MVRKPTCQSLYQLSLSAVVRLLEGVSRLETSKGRVWSQRNIPTLFRERLLEYATAKLIATSNSRDEKRLTMFWSLLYETNLKSVVIPAELDDFARRALVMYLETAKPTATLVFKAFGIFNAMEKESILSHVRNSRALTVFSFRKGADDACLALVGRHCPLLQVSKSRVLECL